MIKTLLVNSMNKEMKPKDTHIIGKRKYDNESQEVQKLFFQLRKKTKINSTKENHSNEDKN